MQTHTVLPVAYTHLRYADILLMHAEAAYYLQREDEARQKVNEVRCV